MGIEGVLLGLQMVSNLNSTRNQYKQQQRMYEAQAKTAQQNAAMISHQREQQAEAYAQKQKQLNDRYRLAKGQARAEAGASGLNADGSIADILSSSEDAYKQDTLNLLQSQRNDSWSAYVNQINYQNQANAYNTASRNARREGHRQMFATLVGSAANIYSRGMDKGWFGNSGGSTNWVDSNMSLNIPTSSNIQGYNLYNQAKKNNPYFKFNKFNDDF